MLHYMFGFIAGISIAVIFIFNYFNVSFKHPYRWKCEEEECVFEVSSNSDDPNLLMHIIEDHKERHDKT